MVRTQFSIASLFVVTAIVGVAMCFGRIAVTGASQLAADDIGIIGWLIGLAAFAISAAAIFLYANR